MTWTDEQVAEAMKRGDEGSIFETDRVRAIMTYAVEQCAAHGGAMDVDDLATTLDQIEGAGAPLLREHIEAIGAKQALNDATFVEQRGHIERLGARVAALDKERDALVLHRDVDIARLEHETRERAEVIEGLSKRLADALADSARLQARCEGLSVAGQVLSEHVDKKDNEPPCDHSHGGVEVRANGIEYCIECDEPVSYPCSSTCTHDDARTTGHAERVKGRGEAVSETLAQGLAAYDEAHADMKANAEYDAGAEAMRAACWEAVQEQMRRMGWVSSERAWREFKAAIEGATP